MAKKTIENYGLLDELYGMTVGTALSLTEKFVRAPLKKKRLQRLNDAFAAALTGEARQNLKQRYDAAGVLDLSALHLKRAVMAQYRHDHGKSRPAKLPAPFTDGPLADDKGLLETGAQSALDVLPQPIRQLLAECGLRTRLARRLADIDPAQARSASLMKNGLSLEFNGRAKYSPDDRLITLLQQRRTAFVFGEPGRFSRPQPDLGYGSNYKDSSEVRHDHHHEAGHALDGLLDKFSQGEAFSAAYEADLKDMDRNAYAADDYFLYYFDYRVFGVHDDPNVARSEAFAELFADALGSGPGKLQKLLPRSASLMQDVLRAVAFEMSGPLDPQALLAGRPEAPSL